MDRTANTSCSESVGVTSSQLAKPSFSSSYSSTPGNRNPTCDIIGRTVKEHDKEIDDLRKENFSLKRRIYLLEQKLSETACRDVAETVQAKSISPNKDETKAELQKSVVEVTDSAGKSQEDYLRKIEELEFDMGIMRSFIKKLQQELNVLKCEKKSPKESVAKLKSPFGVTSSATQTYICAIDDVSRDNMVTKSGQVDCVDTEKEIPFEEEEHEFATGEGGPAAVQKKIKKRKAHNKGKKRITIISPTGTMHYRFENTSDA